MIPIYEQGGGRGIGHSVESFLERFDSICQEHIKEKRAHSFALILYDFSNQSIRKLLKDQGVFAQLDRLSGRELSVFYLHSGSRSTVEMFNKTLVSALDIGDRLSLPAVVFFRIAPNKGDISDVTVAELDSADLIHGFQELYSVVETYLNSYDAARSRNQRYTKWIRSGSRFITLEAVRAALRAFLEMIL